MIKVCVLCECVCVAGFAGAPVVLSLEGGTSLVEQVRDRVTVCEG